MSNRPKPEGCRYYLVENRGVLRITNGSLIYSLGEDGTWIPNQYAMSIFYDGMREYIQITEEDVKNILENGLDSFVGRKI